MYNYVSIGHDGVLSSRLGRGHDPTGRWRRGFQACTAHPVSNGLAQPDPKSRALESILNNIFY